MSKDKLIIIKKYPNRRLYNTEESRYITLNDLAALVKEEKEFKVIDVKTKEDVTRVTLTQIILNHEIEGYNILPIELIKQIIKLYDNPMSKMFNAFMINALQQFNNNFDTYKSLLNNNNPFNNTKDWADYFQDLNSRNAEFIADFLKNVTGNQHKK